MNRRRLILLAPAVLALALTMLAGCEREPARPSFQSIDITGATYAQRLDLPDADGKPRSLADYKGKVVIVFFGYTQCPDVCPTALAEISDLKNRLGADGARVQPVFVTVDPERDTPEVIKAYVGGFGPDYVALRGTPEQTQAVAKEFKVFYAKVPGKAPGSYTVDHTAGLYVFDAKGQVRLFARYGSGADALLADVKLLLAGA
ncbi:MAG TPA: SCO family protein [Burkholderiaceae bacterium]|nr:SCO family protein [Burkholderiaceae bacterium]